jgi:hypothetical protein
MLKHRAVKIYMGLFQELLTPESERSEQSLSFFDHSNPMKKISIRLSEACCNSVDLLKKYNMNWPLAVLFITATTKAASITLLSLYYLHKSTKWR